MLEISFSDRGGRKTREILVPEAKLVVKEIVEKITELLKTAGKLTMRNIQKKIATGERTGAFYIRKTNALGESYRHYFFSQEEFKARIISGRIKRASAPGENPKTDTGKLISSVRISFEKLSKLEVSILIGGVGGVDYARTLNDDLNRPIISDEPTAFTDAVINNATRQFWED